MKRETWTRAANRRESRSAPDARRFLDRSVDRLDGEWIDRRIITVAAASSPERTLYSSESPRRNCRSSAAGISTFRVWP